MNHKTRVSCGISQLIGATQILFCFRQKQSGAGVSGSRDYISPSSDYYSLSPGSPTPGTLIQDPVNNLHHQPVYAKIVKSRQEQNSAANDAINNVNGDDHPRVTPPASLVTRSNSSSASHRKPSAPARALDHERGDSRRHSWAGDKKGKY